MPAARPAVPGTLVLLLFHAVLERLFDGRWSWCPSDHLACMALLGLAFFSGQHPDRSGGLAAVAAHGGGARGRGLHRISALVDADAGPGVLKG